MSGFNEDNEAYFAATSLKNEGNALLGQLKYGLAAEKYSEAIELCPHPVFYSNRAQALIKLESFGLAIMDANEAINLDPKYVKAYYRRGSANFALGKVKAALKLFVDVMDETEELLPGTMLRYIDQQGIEQSILIEDVIRGTY